MKMSMLKKNDHVTRDQAKAPGLMAFSGADPALLISWLLSLLAVIGMMFLIFHFSAANGTNSSHLSKGLSYHVLKVIHDIFPAWLSENQLQSVVDAVETPLRKMAHFSEYTLFSLCMQTHIYCVRLMAGLPGVRRNAGKKGSENLAWKDGKDHVKEQGKKDIMKSYRNDRLKKRLPGILLCVVYAMSDEIHQYFVPGRACRFFDVCVDSLGIFFGCFLFSIIVLPLLDGLFGKGYNEEKPSFEQN